MPINLNFFFTLFVILLLLNDFAIPIFVGKPVIISVSTIMAYICFLLILILNCKTFINETIKTILNKKNSFNWFLIFVSYVIIITIIHALLGKTSYLSILLVILQYLGSLTLAYTVLIYMSNKIMTPKNLLKIFYCTFYIIMLWGIVDFLAFTFHIAILQKIIPCFCNVALLRDVGFDKAYSLGLPRVQSVYFEPGFFAEYIFFFMPILYSLATSKFKIFDNIVLNKIIKISTIPLIWINLILTQSPIWLVFGVITTIGFFGYRIFKSLDLKKVIIAIITFFILGMSCILTIQSTNLKSTYLGRVIAVTENFNDINKLIIAERSLGVRLAHMLNLINIGMRTPFFGAGHSNLVPLLSKQFLEGKSVVFADGDATKMVFSKNPSIHNPPITNIFVRYGGVGLIFYYFFIFKTIFALKRQYNILKDSLLRDFIFGLMLSVTSYIILSCYDMTIGHLICVFVIGISIGIIQRIDTRNLKKEGKQCLKYQ